MGMLRRIANVFRRKRLDATIDEELEFHVAMRATDLERAGMPRAEAQREASRLLGNPAALRDRTRDVDVWVQMEATVQDIRLALRLLWRSPTFTTAAVLTLAIGIGVNTAMFGVVHGVLIQPLPYASPDRLYLLFQSNTRAGGRTRVAPLDFADWRQRSRAFEMAGTVGTGFTLTGGAEPELVIGHLVAGNLFELLGVRPALGRTFDSERDSAAEEMVLSHGLWQRRFGACCYCPPWATKLFLSALAIAPLRAWWRAIKWWALGRCPLRMPQLPLWVLIAMRVKPWPWENAHPWR